MGETRSVHDCRGDTLLFQTMNTQNYFSTYNRIYCEFSVYASKRTDRSNAQNAKISSDKNDNQVFENILVISRAAA